MNRLGILLLGAALVLTSSNVKAMAPGGVIRGGIRGAVVGGLLGGKRGAQIGGILIRQRFIGWLHRPGGRRVGRKQIILRGILR